MSSLRLRALLPILRWKVKRRLSRVQDVRELRRDFALTIRRLPGDIRISMKDMGGVGTEHLRTHSAKGGASKVGASKGTEHVVPTVLLYLHGGAYLGCSPATHRPITSFFARAGFEVYAPAYRLAPENPFPAAVQDALSVYRALLDSGISPARLVIAGDSAGGGLALSLMLAAKQAGLPLPVAAALFSPWTDLAATGASLHYNAHRDVMLDGNVSRAATLYLQGADPYHPLASPLYGALDGLPPLLIEVGADEVLLDDACRLAERVRSSGGSVDLRIWPKVPHAFQIFATFLPESRDSLRRTSRFLHRMAGDGHRQALQTTFPPIAEDEAVPGKALSFP
ncbi:alpha/beta hydrolase [Granulibacter bethesdensis]|uniref:Caprolactone hydrolase n=1 Tax=Granulibacter bethesdensis (strain ATCC BAA-1260 / CGDNIH1) TaxID=391165 RepID=Q0BPY1_GRABC|nr:alpha/beta hydrolase [Granulibacter bethesdensis]ABI63121.1 Caprolactone hydrolase [Granulibacter bethesdensis CGDNIH1]APH52996.1 Caprolactone hydrolase [Granulibacter bethesdensis]APH65685.1 Caprolactone hydrolase [Granulibacter bethesdensis]